MALGLAGCAHWRPPAEPEPSPAQVQSRIAVLLPDGVDDAAGWAQDLFVAFSTRELAPTDANLCAAIGVIGQESSFTADPVVPNLATIARRELERRAASAHVPDFVLRRALALKSSDGRTYDARLSAVRTEGQLSALFDDFLGRVPLGQTLFGRLNPVHSGGPMQVSVAFAEAHDADYPYPVDGTIRREVFSRRGGVYFGVVHLLDYPADYDALRYRFADYNAGHYASRNAAFQRAVGRLSGITLALDGDLLIHGSRQVSQTERATRTLKKRLGLDERDIRDALETGESAGFVDTALYRRVYALRDQQIGATAPRAVLPGIELDSPKITRSLTTVWFAERVESRWNACMARAPRP